MGGSDQRRGRRFRINDEFATLDDGATYVSDLSEHGVFVHTADLLPLGSNIELRFTVLLDDPVIIQGLGHVVRHSQDPPGMGVEFGPLSPDMVLRIHDALSRRRSLEEEAAAPPEEAEETIDVLRTGEFEVLEHMTIANDPDPAEDEEFDHAKTGAFQRIPQLDDADLVVLDDDE